MTFFSNLTTPSNFKGDPVGYGANQVTHMTQGVVFVILFSAFWHDATDALPDKLLILLVGTAGYLAWEIANRWNGFDSLEDTLFFAGYGIGGALLLFTERAPGGTQVIADVQDVRSLLVIPAMHLAYGIVTRSRQSRD